MFCFKFSRPYWSLRPYLRYSATAYKYLELGAMFKFFHSRFKSSQNEYINTHRPPLHHFTKKEKKQEKDEKKIRWAKKKRFFFLPFFFIFLLKMLFHPSIIISSSPSSSSFAFLFPHSYYQSTISSHSHSFYVFSY